MRSYETLGYKMWPNTTKSGSCLVYFWKSWDFYILTEDLTNFPIILNSWKLKWYFWKYNFYKVRISFYFLYNYFAHYFIHISEWTWSTRYTFCCTGSKMFITRTFLLSKTWASTTLTLFPGGQIPDGVIPKWGGGGSNKRNSL